LPSYHPYIKRIFDIIFAIAGILVLLPLFGFTVILIWISSEGPVFFIQNRVGKGGKPFNLIKFRSMTVERISTKGLFEPGDARRVTAIGKFLRKTKVDELPELFNVLVGDMSIVGPRPEVEKYVGLFPSEYHAVLKVKPGLSDLASIKYRNEEKMLATQTNPEKFYLEEILPDKLRLAKKYIEDISFKVDMQIMFKTLKSIFKNSGENDLY
jgi:lipopolysaccharide/colanic/teichoic acid biosynthesis glycosyltransferase